MKRIQEVLKHWGFEKFEIIKQFHEEFTRLTYQVLADGKQILVKGLPEEKPDKAEYDLLWQGTIYMHISYMQCCGPYAVDSLWSILKFGMAQKETLWEILV